MSRFAVPVAVVSAIVIATAHLGAPSTRAYAEAQRGPSTPVAWVAPASVGSPAVAVAGTSLSPAPSGHAASAAPPSGAPSTSAASAAAFTLGASPAFAGSAGGGLDPVDVAAKTTVVLGLLYVVLRLMRRGQMGRAGNGSGIVVLESRALAPKASLYVVSVRGTQLVVGLSPAGLVTLADLGPAPVADRLSLDTASQEVDAVTGVPLRPLLERSLACARRVVAPRLPPESNVSFRDAMRRAAHGAPDPGRREP